jgi:hypothetical protein
MSAKLISKTHLQNTFFDFWAFFAHLASKFEKSTNMTWNFFFFKSKKGGNKRRISRWFRIRWNRFEKMHPKKVISKNVTEICIFFTLTHVRQTCFACNFFWWILLQLFQRIRNQREIMRFLISFLIFCKKKFLGVILAFFANFEAKCAKNGSKNQKRIL